MDTVKVSVIIPTYNHARYVGEAIQSVLDQTLQDCEIIVVDDGSTDHTQRVVDQFGERVEYIYQENQGLSAARNTGIRAAAGQYMAFLDADDLWKPDFLQECIEMLETHQNLGGVYAHFGFIDSKGKLLPQVGRGETTCDTLREQLLEGGFFPPHAALISREAVQETGWFDQSLTSVEDWDYWLRLSERRAMAEIPKILVHYRVYPGSMSTNAPRMHKNRMIVLGKCFGPPYGVPHDWDDEQRLAYGFAYQTAAFEHIQCGDYEEGWRYLKRAIELWPQLLHQVGLFYELFCWDQPRGFRGQASTLNLDKNASAILERLELMLTENFSSQDNLQGVALGNAHLVLAMLYDQTANWRLARAHLVRAIRYSPGLMASHSTTRRLLKLSLGQKIASWK